MPIGVMGREIGARELTALAGAVAVSVGVLAAARALGARSKRSTLRRTLQQKQAELRTSMAAWKTRSLQKISEERSNAIVSLPFDELRDRLQSGDLTAVEVLNAYQRKAAVENDKYNFVCEPIAEAEEVAAACDQLQDRRSKPLLGIPVSVKENVPVKGYDCTLGLAGLAFRPCKENSPCLQVLIDHGAVPFIRTNIPQLCASVDTNNPLYGQTVNPHCTDRSCGGSSGGEGCALGCSASIIGLGNDSAGSVRIPAAWCGVCSLKPTTRRTPWPSFDTIAAGQGIVRVSTGPMARSVDGLITMSEALFSQDMRRHDPYMSTAPLDLKTITDRKPLRIGFFVGNGVVDMTRSSVRAMEEVKAVLEKQGHQLFSWSPPQSGWTAFELLLRCITGDGREKLTEITQNEVLTTAVQGLSLPVYVPVLLRKLLKYLLYPFLPRYLWKIAVAIEGTESVVEWWKLQELVDLNRMETIRSWQKQGLDAVICPAMPCPAMCGEDASKTTGIVCSASIFNLLDFPAGVLPVTKVNQADVEHDMQHYQPIDAWHDTVKQNSLGSVGLPVAVQCVALPLQEELCLRLMKEIEECVAAIQSH